MCGTLTQKRHASHSPSPHHRNARTAPPTPPGRTPRRTQTPPAHAACSSKKTPHAPGRPWPSIWPQVATRLVAGCVAMPETVLRRCLRSSGSGPSPVSVPCPGPSMSPSRSGCVSRRALPTTKRSSKWIYEAFGR